MAVVTILVDDPDSWVMPYMKNLISLIPSQFNATIVHKHNDVASGEILFIIGCDKIVDKSILKRNKHNLVIHESDLPEGKGWSPMSWQVLEGKNKITIVLFEATEEVDSGPIYLKENILLNGTELYDEIKENQGKKTICLILKFLKGYPNIQSIPQTNKPGTYYKKRSPKDDQLDINKTIKDSFNLLRIVNNEKYPAWFEHNGEKYILKIYKK